ncbi:MAG: DUF262 domain-containing protein [Bacteroidetes bacterium]|nr:DUF262 domain-containing protein [Bacteroidota bacterium]
MKSKTAFKTIEDFLYQENKTIVIPNYQRGYKWAIKESENLASAVEKLLDHLLDANKDQPYFLQGLTVVEKENEIILIDGQQRTTTLYLLLWVLNKELINSINLKYEIREQSKEFIELLKKDSFDYNLYDIENKHQDIFYFKEAISQIRSKIGILKKKENGIDNFIDFVLKKVTILYIVIDQDKATKTFTMMNGSKATMLQEELVKAEMFRRISLPDVMKREMTTSVNDSLYNLKEIIAKDWEINALRSQYAREWDKWLYWWNQDEVIDFFSIEKPLGLLLDFYLWKEKDKPKNTKLSDFNFDEFKNLLTGNREINKGKTKKVFKHLRDIQKLFEDLFNTPQIYNYLGIALIDAKEDKFKMITYYMANKSNHVKLQDYAKYRILGCSAELIERSEKDGSIKEIQERAMNFATTLKLKFLYNNFNDSAFKYLMYLNVKEDINLNRKFDFTIWKNKSLEHIFPKSKVYHTNELGIICDGNENEIEEWKKSTLNDGSWIKREDFKNEYSEHCIGNLVLLYGRDNSAFGAKTVYEKKRTYFDVKEKFDSRHLIHTMSVFAENTCGLAEIEQNTNKIFEQFNIDYNLSNNGK